MLGKIVVWALATGIISASPVHAQENGPEENWRRIDSRCCTIFLHPDVEIKKVNREISTWRIRPRIKVPDGTSAEGEMAAKFDTLFRRAQEILDMYPPGVHTTVKILEDKQDIQGIHVKQFGYGTKAIAFYLFEKNTIYAARKDLSERVLAHEMGHCIIDHYFRVRPPRKIEELLASQVDTQLRG